MVLKLCLWAYWVPFLALQSSAPCLGYRSLLPKVCWCSENIPAPICSHKCNLLGPEAPSLAPPKWLGQDGWRGPLEGQWASVVVSGPSCDLGPTWRIKQKPSHRSPCCLSHSASPPRWHLNDSVLGKAAAAACRHLCEGLGSKFETHLREGCKQVAGETCSRMVQYLHSAGGLLGWDGAEKRHRLRPSENFRNFPTTDKTCF